VEHFVNPEYEFVALHPNHILPDGKSLLAYDSTTQTQRPYTIAQDGHFRDTDGNRFPSFHHRTATREQLDRPNVFLFAINSGMKFQRYFNTYFHNVPELAPEVIDLMERNNELVELLYWKPNGPNLGSRSTEVTEQASSNRRNPPGPHGPTAFS
jgi:hypothetical protein